LGVGEALGRSGERVEALLASVAGTGDAAADIVSVAPSTPAGRVSLPVEVVDLHTGVQAAAGVDRSWLAAVGAARDRPRASLLAEGRAPDVDAALNVTMLLVTERLDPADDREVDAHVASGAQLWLLTGAVVSALSGVDPEPFAPWASLVAAGWWPVGPSGGCLVVAGTGAHRIPTMVGTSGAEGWGGSR
jgi:hypothetical protein